MSTVHSRSKIVLFILAVGMASAVAHAGDKKTKEGISKAIQDRIDQCMKDPNASGCDSGKEKAKGPDAGMEYAKKYMQEQKAEQEKAEAPCKKDPNSAECKNHREYEQQSAMQKTKQLGGLINEMAQVKTAKSKAKLDMLRSEVKTNCDKKASDYSEDMCNEAKQAYRDALKQ